MQIPNRVLEAWQERDGPSVLTTVDADGLPNTIWVNIVRLFDGDKLAIGDIVFSKTRANLQLPNAVGNYLWLTKEKKSFQIKGHFTYETEGERFETLQAETDPKFTLVAAAVLHVDEIWEGAERLA